MKLRNKKTGEIGWLYCDHISVPKKMTVFSDDKDLFASHWDYKSLAELNEEWEDYEEPKEYWYLDLDGRIFESHDENGMTKDMKEIGNYFETKEEAEQAVEKLKAITRLNKCSFRFEGYNNRDRVNGGYIVIYAHVDIPNNNLLEEAQPDMLSDLDLLFGGEE